MFITPSAVRINDLANQIIEVHKANEFADATTISTAEGAVTVKRRKNRERISDLEFRLANPHSESDRNADLAARLRVAEARIRDVVAECHGHKAEAMEKSVELQRMRETLASYEKQLRAVGEMRDQLNAENNKLLEHSRTLRETRERIWEDVQRLMGEVAKFSAELKRSRISKANWTR